MQAAIYYFITALFMLLACFDTYFALPLNVNTLMMKILMITMVVVMMMMITIPVGQKSYRYHNDNDKKLVLEDNDDDLFLEQRFYRYHEHLHHKSVVETQKSVILPTSYWDIFKKCAPQVDSIFLLLHFSYFKKMC